MSQPGHPGIDAIGTELHGVLCEFFRSKANAMVTKWTAQVEAIDEDGTSALWTLSAPGMAVWEKMMFPHYHEKHEEIMLAVTIRRENND